MKKLNKKQKDHLKKILKRTLNIFCYICTGILALFLLIFSLQSCQQKRMNGVSAENTDGLHFNYSYNYNLDSQVFLTSVTRSSLLSAFDLSDGDVYWEYEEGEIIEYEYPLAVNSQCIFNGEYFIDVTSIKYTFKVYDDNDDHLFINLKSLELGYQSGYVSVMYKLNEIYNSYGYQTGFYGDILSDNYLNDVNGVNVLYTLNIVSSFEFNKIFNYNAPMSVSVSSPYGTGVSGGTSQGTLFTKLVINCGWFISNNQLFDRIEFWYQLSDGSSFDFDGTIKQGPQGMWFYWTTYYVNSNTDTMVVVNSRDQVAYMPTTSTYGYYWANSSTWTNDNFRNITFLYTLSDTQRNQIEQFNNNNQNSYSGNIVSGDVNNIFTLIGTAFTSLLPILNVNILTGVTIGTLLFIPLVATLVFAIIRIIKK